MLDKPSAAWYLAPIFLGIIGSAIMWFVLKDKDHPDSPKMVKKGWIIGIVLTLISFAWIPFVLLPFAFIGGVDQQQVQLENEIREESQSNRNLMQKVSEDDEQSQSMQEETPQIYDCAGNSGCFTEYVTRIVDGDTIYTDTLKIRLSLTNTPEINKAGYSQATLFTETLCPVGSKILVDQDDLQPVDIYGRILAKVSCGDKVLNSELLYNGYANILTEYCSTSEFSGESWAQNYGCGTKNIQQPTLSSQTKENNCDPSYPDFCITPPPPDLDCKDIPQKRFTVLQPDPHRFDGDKDGIGCES